MEIISIEKKTFGTRDIQFFACRLASPYPLPQHDNLLYKQKRKNR